MTVAIAIPTATYRLQLHAGFAFADAAAIVPYLAELGISHLYLSPILQAAEGSTHGYDVVDPDRVSAALGGEAGFQRLAEVAREHGLRILLDIVPNHMSIAIAAGAGPSNKWWCDVLENGPASYFAHYFDVDWTSDDDRVTLPILGERYGRALASGYLGVVHDGAGGFKVRAGDMRLPIAPRSLGVIVRRAGDAIGHAELAFLGDGLSGLPRSSRADERRRRHRDKAVLARRISELCADRTVASAIDAEVAAVVADRVELDGLLERQAYRLVHWTVSASQLSYRRFFDISTLVGLRTEEADVFDACHARITGWLADGTIAGVRVDHVDGLRDPAAYVERLRERAPDAWIVVEKILGDGEHLPGWRVDGTTGYDFGEHVGTLLVDPAGERALTEAFETYTGTTWDPVAASRAARREVMSDALHSELSRLVELASRACAASPACRDFTRAEVEAALKALFAGYTTYRTYLDADPGDRASERERDRDRIELAARAAEAVDPDLLAFLEAALAFEMHGGDVLELARAAQQISGAIVAKGDEDTLGYRQVRLTSRCEVGAHLPTFAASPEIVHAQLASAPPRGLLATTTHDTKRGEDVRARIAVLSEVPAAWRGAVTIWRTRADKHWGEVAPDRILEYTMWQALVGAWPLPLARAKPYALKLAREARLRTSWRAPDQAYEAALARWVTGIYEDADLMAQIEKLVASISARGDANALAQLLLKLTAPGVPDIYQGCELRDDSLVDPDNRRPVDYDQRRAALRETADLEPPTDLSRAKLWTVRRVLALRRRQPELFAGPYRALAATGPRRDRVFTFERADKLIVVVPRLGGIDPETMISLPPGAWRDALSGLDHAGTVRVADLWRRFPVSLLTCS